MSANYLYFKLVRQIISLISLSTIVWGAQVMALGWTGLQLDGTKCRGKVQGFGPYDYWQVIASKQTNPNLWWEARLYEVDRIHYGKGKTELNEKGITPLSIRSIFKEFDYTLRAFPNYSNALYSMINLELKRIRLNKLDPGREIPKMITPPECYLLRAISYKPKQADLYLLYGIYLHKMGQLEISKEYYLKALKLDPKYSEAHYNLGLLLFDLEEYDVSVKHAKKAIEYGYLLPGLKKKLLREGYWPKD